MLGGRTFLQLALTLLSVVAYHDVKELFDCKRAEPISHYGNDVFMILMSKDVVDLKANIDRTVPQMESAGAVKLPNSVKIGFPLKANQTQTLEVQRAAKQMPEMQVPKGADKKMIPEMLSSNASELDEPLNRSKRGTRDYLFDVKAKMAAPNYDKDRYGREFLYVLRAGQEPVNHQLVKTTHSLADLEKNPDMPYQVEVLTRDKRSSQYVVRVHDALYAVGEEDVSEMRIPFYEEDVQHTAFYMEDDGFGYTDGKSFFDMSEYKKAVNYSLADFDGFDYKNLFTDLINCTKKADTTCFISRAQLHSDLPTKPQVMQIPGMDRLVASDRYALDLRTYMHDGQLIKLLRGVSVPNISESCIVFTGNLFTDNRMSPVDPAFETLFEIPLNIMTGEANRPFTPQVLKESKHNYSELSNDDKELTSDVNSPTLHALSLLLAAVALLTAN